MLALFDPKKEMKIEPDAFKDGLGASLQQERRPVAFTSRSSIKTEQQYAQIEEKNSSLHKNFIILFMGIKN